MERRRWDDPEVETFLREGRPVVLTGGVPLTRPLIGKWSFDYLAEHYKGPNGLNVHFAPRSTTRFARFYGEGAGKGGILAMSFKQFADVVARNEAEDRPPWRHYMQWMLLWSEEKQCGKCEQQVSGGALRMPGGETMQHAVVGDVLEADLRSLDYDWLARMCAVAGCDGMTETNLWAGASGGCTPIHFDETSNFLCQVRGRKRLLLVSPGQTAKLYPYPTGHPAHAFSMVDVESPDLATFPAFGRVKGVECILEPGECLFLPSYVWHYVKQWEGDETLSLNFWVGGRKDVRKDRMVDAERHGRIPPPSEVEAATAEAAAEAAAAIVASAASARRAGLCASPQQRGVPDVPTDDALLEAGDDDGLLCMQMARHVEKETAVTMMDDAPRAGVFLSALAAGADSRWPPGAPARQIATQVRTHLITMLGQRRAAAVLRGLARDGRLDPGLAPPLGKGVVGTDEAAFSSREELRRWVSQGGPEAEKETRKKTLL